MINAVLIDAYRSIKGPARIDFSNITLLCGPNSAGKSSLIRVLDFFKLLSFNLVKLKRIRVTTHSNLHVLQLFSRRDHQS